MRLITAHRILIGAGIAFFAFYALFQLKRFADLGQAWALVQAVVAGVIAIGFVFYYRSLREWGRW